MGGGESKKRERERTERERETRDERERERERDEREREREREREGGRDRTERAERRENREQREAESREQRIEENREKGSSGRPTPEGLISGPFRVRLSGTEKVPQRTCATKILPNFRVNFLVRFASKPLFCWGVPSNCSENSLVLFVQFFGFGVLFWPWSLGLFWVCFGSVSGPFRIRFGSVSGCWVWSG